jgi:hypothetical protein
MASILLHDRTARLDIDQPSESHQRTRRESRWAAVAIRYSRRCVDLRGLFPRDVLPDALLARRGQAVEHPRALAMRPAVKAGTCTRAACMASDLSDRLRAVQGSRLIIAGFNDLFTPPWHERWQMGNAGRHWKSGTG